MSVVVVEGGETPEPEAPAVEPQAIETVGETTVAVAEIEGETAIALAAIAAETEEVRIRAFADERVINLETELSECRNRLLSAQERVAILETELSTRPPLTLPEPSPPSPPSPSDVGDPPAQVEPQTPSEEAKAPEPPKVRKKPIWI